jgi:hypothetical protein
MKRTLFLMATALAMLVLGSNTARADTVTPSDLIQYSFSWTHNLPGSVILADGETNAGVVMTKESGSAIGGTDFVASNLTTFSQGTPSSPSKLTTNGAYQFTVSITDQASGETQTATFSGKLGGKFGAGFAKVTNHFDSTQPVTLFFKDSGNTYIIYLDQYVAPGNPTQMSNGTTTQSQGSLGGHIVTIAPGDVQKVPEPSSILLGGFGLSLVGGAWWRKRRQAQNL